MGIKRRRALGDIIFVTSFYLLFSSLDLAVWKGTRKNTHVDSQVKPGGDKGTCLTTQMMPYLAARSVSPNSIIVLTSFTMHCEFVFWIPGCVTTF
jgi:hypothetical protein